MKKTYIVLALLLSLTACGVKRDLKLPEKEKPESHTTETSAPE